jgi:hypothetical protein
MDREVGNIGQSSAPVFAILKREGVVIRPPAPPGRLIVYLFGIRILVIDDQDDFRFLVVCLLEMNGAIVR